MNHLKLAGRRGVLKQGYYAAASVGEWEVSGGNLSAVLLSSDAFRLSQPALTFEVPVKNGRPWVWPVSVLSIAGTTLTASLGPLKE